MELERYRPRALATALAVLGDHHQAEDAVQEAMVEAVRCWDTVRDESRRAAWFRSIVRHRCHRVLRRRDLGAVPLPEIGQANEPWRHASRREERVRLLGRIRALPRHLREVVALHYLSGCTHRETSAFLGVPVTTVNNRLHKARRHLSGGGVMTLTEVAGTVTRVEDPVVELRFPSEGRPEIFDALAAAGSSPSLRVVQSVDDETVRCLRLRGDTPAVGDKLVNATADGGTYMSVVAGADELVTAVGALGEPRSGMIETGIKPVDLFCPLPRHGTVATMGTSGTGKMVLTLELLERLGDAGPRIFCLSDRREPALVRDLREEAESFDRRVVWIVTDVASDPEYAATNDTFDAVAYTSPLLGIRGLWPAVDPLRSRSATEVGERHARLADEARTLLRDLRVRTMDPELLELLAVRAYGTARRRLAELSELDDPAVRRARRLEAFLTHPFDVGKEITGKDGETVTLADTLDGVESILRGEWDDRPVEDLMYVGALPR